jgi:phosphoribosylaminoimidazolecarboxamide formyltransferase/IMP cyclohydrolase
MIRASAKNFIRVASVVDPGDYDKIIAEMTANDGKLSLELRFALAQKAFDHTAGYDRHIADFLGGKRFGDVQTCYRMMEG